MALTRVAAAGINTGQTFVLQNVNTSGIVTAGTVQVGSATTIHSAGIDLGGGNITSHNINSTGIITATGGFVGAVTGNVTGNLTGNVTGNVTGDLTGDVTGDLTGNVTGNVTGNLTGTATTASSLSGTPNVIVGVLTATDAVINGNLTVQGTTTTLDTTLTEVDRLEVGANNATVGVAITQSGTGDILRLYDSSTQVVTVTDGGSVGIGTDNPAVNLHVNSASSTGRIRIQGGGTSSAQLQLMGAGRVNPWVITGDSSDRFIIYDNADARLTIDSSGRLLVGTNSAVGGGSVGELLQVGFSGGARAILANTSTSLANGALLGQIDFNTNVGSSISTGANIKANCDGTAGSGDAPTRLTFWTTADAASTPTERMRISANGDISIDSNAFYFDAVNNRFGVGTASPGAPLDVVGGNTQALFQGGTNLNGLIRIRPNGTAVYSAVYFDNAAGTSTAGITCAHGATFYIDSASNGDIYHRTNGTGSHVWTVNSGAAEAARIDSSGRLLLGTVSSFNGGRLCVGTGQGVNTPGGEHIKLAPNANRIEFLDSSSNASDIGAISLWNTVYNNRSANIELFHPAGNLGGIRFETHDGTSLAERMRITSSSGTQINVVGRTSADSGAFRFVNNSQAVQWSIATNSSNFYVADSDFSHYAYLNQNPTAWQFASDARLKENIVDIGYGIETIKQLQPRQFNFINNPETVLGFVAQELRPVVPEAVSGVEQEFSDDDTPEELAQKSLGVAKDTLIPVLVKALQEAVERIETLETTNTTQAATIATLDDRLTALEGQ